MCIEITFKFRSYLLLSLFILLSMQSKKKRIYSEHILNTVQTNPLFNVIFVILFNTKDREVRRSASLVPKFATHNRGSIWSTEFSIFTLARLTLLSVSLSITEFYVFQTELI